MTPAEHLALLPHEVQIMLDLAKEHGRKYWGVLGPWGGMWDVGVKRTVLFFETFPWMVGRIYILSRVDLRLSIGIEQRFCAKSRWEFFGPREGSYFGDVVQKFSFSQSFQEDVFGLRLARESCDEWLSTGWLLT